ncbi:unnamed protein product [Cylicocyclus nassatus]|uniref:SCP domain-containing protein n=1 Tax=Cylicocyclus nassatus TaxID=53992 RepID=A0AA36GZZ0_CYLNA|nr:unnamed protein product [Cylicocyclus nassatus]
MYTHGACENGLGDDEAQAVLELINEARSSLAKGELEGNGDYFTAAKNMNKLAWSCELESHAAKLIGFCDMPLPSEIPVIADGLGWSHVWEDHEPGNPAIEIVDMVQSILNLKIITDPRGLSNYSDNGAPSFPNLMQAAATKLGCTIQHCPSLYDYYDESVSVLCLTDRTLTDGSEVYTEGSADDCECSGDRVCNPVTMICEVPTATFTTSTIITTTPTTTSTTMAIKPSSNAVSPFSTREAQSNISLQSTSPQSSTSWPFTTASTKSIKSTRQCVTRPRCVPAKSRKARAANFGETFSGKLKRHMSQKMMKKIDTVEDQFTAEPQNDTTSEVSVQDDICTGKKLLSITTAVEFVDVLKKNENLWLLVLSWSYKSERVKAITGRSNIVCKIEG